MNDILNKKKKYERGNEPVEAICQGFVRLRRLEIVELSKKEKKNSVKCVGFFLSLLN